MNLISSTLSFQISNLITEKNSHGVKFIEILNKAKKRNKEIKIENKMLQKKLLKIEEEYNKLTKNFNKISKCKSKLEWEVEEMKEQIIK